MKPHQFVRRPRLLRKPWWTSDSEILLTFDDGPTTHTTPRVLDVLAEFGVRAVFFQIGERIRQLPDLAKQVKEAGHEIGNHTQHHQVLRPWHFSEAKREILDCQQTTHEILGEAPNLFRPPLGKLLPGHWWTARRQRLTICNWTLDTNDWKCRSEADADLCAAEILEDVRPGDVVLLHDANPFCPRILQRILPVIQQPSVLRTDFATNPGAPH